MTWWIFKRPNPSEPSDKAVGERLDRLERLVRDLRVEWENTYEKIHRALAKLNKRYRDLEAKEPPAEPGQLELEQPAPRRRSRMLSKRRRA